MALLPLSIPAPNGRRHAREARKRMRDKRVRILVEIALAVALSAVLNLFQITLPVNIAGGSVSLDMVPIFVVALRLGLVPGLVAGAMWGMFDLLFQPYIVHPVQLVLDYPLAFALCGLAGLGAVGANRALRAGRFGTTTAWVVASVLVGGAGRFVSHFVSGVVFFGSSAPAGQPVWVYSAVYNLSYMAPSLLAAMVIVPILFLALSRALPSDLAEPKGGWRTE